MVNHILPVFVVIVVDEHSLYISEVAPLLFVALYEFILEHLYLRLHLVGVEDYAVVNPTLTVEFPYLVVEEFGIIVYIDYLVLCFDVRWTNCEVLFNTDDFLAD